MIVAKFGGSSLANAANFNMVMNTIESDDRRKIIVVSAPGARFKGDTKVTDLLIKAARATPGSSEAKGFVEDICARLAEIAEGVGAGTQCVSGAEADLMGRLAMDASQKEMRLDAVKAFGEEWCARVMAAAFSARGKKAKFIDPREAGMSVTTEYGNARQTNGCYKKLSKLANYDGITVVPGFYGGTSRGSIATFSRGGSDLSGSIIAAAVKAEAYENFSDVPGICAADPGIVDNPRLISELTFRELRELTYSGFSVFHDEAIRPLVEHAPDIPILVRHSDGRDTFTKIVNDRKQDDNCVVGIAADTNFVSFNVEKHLMNREIGYGRKLLHIIEKKGLSFEHTPSSIDSISVIIRLPKEYDPKTKSINQEIVAANKATVAGLLEDIKTKLNPAPDIVKADTGLAMIAIVGEGMKESVGTAAKATAAFASASANIEMISQGASEISIVFGVMESRVGDAVRSLYKTFFA
ncbi:MAG TPA: aspartate kinase [bacterium]|nr:aspartate kinase [bacterium]